MKTKFCKSLALCSVFAGAGVLPGIMGGCGAQGSWRYHRLVSPEQKKTQDTWSIAVVSYSLLHVPLFPDPTHNALIIFDAQEKFFASIHGVAMSAITRKPVTLGNNANALQVMFAEEFMRLNPPSCVSEILCGSKEEILGRYLVMLDAARFLNDQGLTYDLIEMNGTAQNSNSVAYTMVRLLGVEFPKENLQEWVPGHGRYLLPSGWQSEFEHWQPPVAGTDFLEWYVDEMTFALYERREQTLQKFKPAKDIFFNPDKSGRDQRSWLIDDAQTAYAEYLSSISTAPSPAQP